jgi:hypothetical protein
MSENLNIEMHSLSVLVAIAVAALLLAGAFCKLADRASELGQKMADDQSMALAATK